MISVHLGRRVKFITIIPTGTSQKIRRTNSNSSWGLGGLLLLLILVGSFGNIASADKGRWHSDGKPRRVIISTDVAIGLIDTHGGKSLVPSETSVVPQDIDDGLALVMALNLDAERILNVLAVVPIFGNASLPPEMLVARKIIHELK